MDHRGRNPADCSATIRRRVRRAAGIVFRRAGSTRGKRAAGYRLRAARGGARADHAQARRAACGRSRVHHGDASAHRARLSRHAFHAEPAPHRGRQRRDQRHQRRRRRRAHPCRRRPVSRLDLRNARRRQQLRPRRQQRQHRERKRDDRRGRPDQECRSDHAGSLEHRLPSRQEWRRPHRHYLFRRRFERGPEAPG